MADATQGSLSRRAAIGTGWLIGFRVLTRTLGLISTLALARILVPADFGLVAMATAFSAAVDSLSQIGVQDALLRRREDDRSLLDTAFTLQALRGLITGGIVAISATTVARLLNEPRLVPVLLVLAVTRRKRSGECRYRRIPAQPALSLPVRAAGGSTHRRGLHDNHSGVHPATYWALLAGASVSVIFRLIMSYILHPYRPRLAFADWRKLSGFSFWLWLTSLACLAWDRCDPFILGPVLGTAQLGVYLLATEVATLPLTELVQPAAEVLFAGILGRA